MVCIEGIDPRNRISRQMSLCVGGIEMELAATWSKPLVAVATHDPIPRVAIWNIATGRKVSEFPAVYDFGGSRVAISEDGRFVVTAAYSRPGVHAYRVSDGERMWISGRSRKAQRVAISGDCKRVFVCYNSAPMAELDAADGTVMTLASGVERIVVSPHTNHAVENRAHKLFLVRPGKDIEIGLQGPVMAAFARSECALSTAFVQPTYVAVFGLRNGRERNRIESAGIGQFNEITYRESSRSFLAVQQVSSGKPLHRMIEIRGRREANRVVAEFELAYSHCFAAKGTLLIDSDGRVFSTKTWRVLRRIKLPQD